MLSDPDRERLRILLAARSFRTGRFTLASGRTSTLYFNLKPTMLHPLGAELAARALLGIARDVGATHLSGLEMGAVPLLGAVGALSSMEGTPLPATFVRKAAKAHGTSETVEGLGPGETLAGADVLILEDVVTTGGSVLKAAAAIRTAGGRRRIAPSWSTARKAGPRRSPPRASRSTPYSARATSRARSSADLTPSPRSRPTGGQSRRSRPWPSA